jgi:hypothetical protein
VLSRGTAIAVVIVLCTLIVWVFVGASLAISTAAVSVVVLCVGGAVYIRDIGRAR